MSAAVAAILEDHADPGDLRMHQADGRCAITAGSVVLFEYAADDIVMRNMVLAALRQLGFPGRAVARVLGLTESYVSTLFSAAKRDGSAALVSQPRRGRPGTVSGRQWELAREWRAADVSDAEIGRRLGVAHTTIGRGLGQREQAARQPAPAPLQAEPLFIDPGAAPGADAEPDAAQAGPGAEPDAEPEPAGEPAGRPGNGVAGDRGERVRVPACGGDAAARVLRAGGRGRGAGQQRRQAAAGAGAAVGGQHVLPR